VKLSVLDQAPISEGSSFAAALESSVALAARADELGYQRYWAAEHHAMNALASPAPEILLARIAAATRTIRLGSGGIMLPHYSPLKVAEVFTMLNALSGGRIEIGVGRAPGGSPLEAYALRRERLETRMPDDFGEQLAELLAYLDQNFEAGHPFGRIKMSRDTPGGERVWLLGSSLWSSRAAAELGLPYAFAHFFSGEDTRTAITQYRANFKPSKYRSVAEATAAVSVICAPTQAEADFLAGSAHLMRQRLRTTGEIRPIASPDVAQHELGLSARAPASGNEWPALIAGTPDSVYAELDRMTAALGIDELFVVTITFDPAMRLRSYELLAQRAGLTPRRA
jgi:luciferase family oxidoreductase group 1